MLDHGTDKATHNEYYLKKSSGTNWGNKGWIEMSQNKKIR